MNTKQKVAPAEEELIREAQRKYRSAYYKKNKKRILENNKKWNKENPERIKEINRNYWLRKAEEQKQATE